MKIWIEYENSAAAPQFNSFGFLDRVSITKARLGRPQVLLEVMRRFPDHLVKPIERPERAELAFSVFKPAG